MSSHETSGKDLVRREGRERERGPDWRLEVQAKLEGRRYRTIMTKPEFWGDPIWKLRQNI